MQKRGKYIKIFLKKNEWIPEIQYPLYRHIARYTTNGIKEYLLAAKPTIPVLDLLYLTAPTPYGVGFQYSRYANRRTGRLLS